MAKFARVKQVDFIFYKPKPDSSSALMLSKKKLQVFFWTAVPGMLRSLTLIFQIFNAFKIVIEFFIGQVFVYFYTEILLLYVMSAFQWATWHDMKVEQKQCSLFASHHSATFLCHCHYLTHISQVSKTFSSNLLHSASMQEDIQKSIIKRARVSCIIQAYDSVIQK